MWQAESVRSLADLPKAHLHLHLEAGMRPSTLADLAAKYGLEMPTIRGYGSFSAFSEMYVAATVVLRAPEDWHRLAQEICEDHVADGAVYLEPSFWAANYRHVFASDQECWSFVLETFQLGRIAGTRKAVGQFEEAFLFLLRGFHAGLND